MINQSGSTTKFFAALSFPVLALVVAFLLSSADAPKPLQSVSATVTAPVPPDTIRISISAVGDIMAHQPQLTAQLQADGTYDFTDNYVPMKSLLSYADISIANLETTFAGKNKGYSSYPRFNTPDALADAIKSSGINVLVTTNNHAFDYGGEALLRTQEVLQEKGITYVGSRKKLEDKNYIIKTVKGVKLGITAFTYESGYSLDSLKTINGLQVPKEYEELLNSYDPVHPEKDLRKMQAIIAAMKKDSAEFIVFVMHWGIEYQSLPNAGQQYMAQQLNRMGVDIIFGSHPHVIQPIDFIQNDSTGQFTFVAYSMGNFISNQRYETMQNYNTEDGLFVGAELIKVGNERPKIKRVFYEPTWVNKYKAKAKYQYEVIPSNVYAGKRSSITLTPEQWLRIDSSNARSTRLIENYLKLNQPESFDKYVRRYVGKGD